MLLDCGQIQDWSMSTVLPCFIPILIANGHTHYLKQGLENTLYVSDRELLSSPEIVLLCRLDFTSGTALLLPPMAKMTLVQPD